MLAFLPLFSPLYGSDRMTLKSFASQKGECEIGFPEAPNFMEQSLQLPEDRGTLRYEVYLSPFENKGVFMLLIATYPASLDQENSVAGLEGLVRGIVHHHPDNRLVFAKMMEFSKHPSLTFLVQSPNNYFRGQAVMVDNKLYLIAMEGKKDTLDEKVFTRFIQTFRLVD
ncbi:MAG: hypothetical protein KGI80_04520 [Verrucomicrobiota bacterium]|nr:hypothetical protein [Verrucomicrobiota bacterium]